MGKIKYVKVKFDDSFQYKFKNFKPCCKAMAEHNDQLFLSGKYEDVNNEYTCNEYGRYIPKVCLYKSETYSSWGDEFTDEYYYPVNYCPFCGAKYEYEVVDVDEVDYSDIYSLAVQKRKYYWDKFNKCDSKKKSENLRAIVKKYDDFINEFYQITEFVELSKDDVERIGM